MREIRFRVWKDEYQEMFCVAPNYLDHANAMQYTGLKDKNDKEIYEGDILCINYDRTIIGSVTFTDGAFRVSELEEFCWLRQNTINTHEIEIIGNIYENPELLDKLAGDL